MKNNMSIFCHVAHGLFLNKKPKKKILKLNYLDFFQTRKNPENSLNHNNRFKAI
jgi:hypothetical protein